MSALTEVDPSQIVEYSDVPTLLPDEEYNRIDLEVLKKYEHLKDTNAVHGAMSFPRGIERYHIYRKGGKQELACIVRIGEKLCGHPGVVHGGVISTLFDNSFGWLFFACHENAGFTANLSVNFRRPILADSTGVMKVYIESQEGRKTFCKATWEVDGVLAADSTALFVKPRPAPGIPSTVATH